MDLHDFDTTSLYFDDEGTPEVEALLGEASEGYADGRAELPLLRAYFKAPDQLTVLVGLYRFFFYQHRLDDADDVAIRAMAVSGGRLGFPPNWESLDGTSLAHGTRQSMGLARFWLMSLKARAILALRRQQMEEAAAMLGKLRELDEMDRLGIAPLIAVLNAARAADVEPA